MKRSIKNIVKNEITKDDALKWIIENNDLINEIKGLKRKKNWKIIIGMNNRITKFFAPLFLHNEGEHEQPETKDMPDLESGKSAAQGRKQEAQALKILTPDQMLIRLPIT